MSSAAAFYRVDINRLKRPCIGLAERACRIACLADALRLQCCKNNHRTRCWSPRPSNAARLERITGTRPDRRRRSGRSRPRRTRVSAAPPSRTGTSTPLPRPFPSRFSRITTVDLTSSPLIPMACARGKFLHSGEHMADSGTLMPRLMTRIAVVGQNDLSTRFLPISCTSPLTVASTMVPFS